MCDKERKIVTFCAQSVHTCKTSRVRTQYSKREREKRGEGDGVYTHALS
jgi:hypothetical protein